MELEKLYFQVKNCVSSLDFDNIWPGFKPLKFALYDDKSCFFDGNYIEKTDEFCANTSIAYKGEQIAIWMVQQEMELSVLTSKIVHEMFHGHQSIMGWDCWPNELEALYRYEYNAENLSLKRHENELLLRMINGFDAPALRELLAHRKYRSIKFPYQFAYESKVEEIEGTANYVEWQALRQLDKNKADELTERMRTLVIKPERLFPVRSSCYYTGALMINALRGADMYSFSAAERPMLFTILKDAASSDGQYAEREALLTETGEALAAFNKETDAIILSAVEKNIIVLNGPVELAGLNVYDARCRNGFMTSTYFLMYKEENKEDKTDKLLQGNFVIKMQDERTIDSVYRWE